MAVKGEMSNLKVKVILIFEHKKNNTSFDIEVPLSITANELIYGLNNGLNLGLDLNNVAECYLCTEEPRTLLRGDVTLEEFGLRDGCKICFQK